jgi:hypothetical protein
MEKSNLDINLRNSTDVFKSSCPNYTTAQLETFITGYLSLYKTLYENRDIIQTMVDTRKAFFKKHEESWDNVKKDYKEEENPLDDILHKKINEALLLTYETLEPTFILETLTTLGGSPILIYDDNGNFAITESIFSEVVTEKHTDTYHLNIAVEPNFWKPTIKEAIIYYLLNED